MRVMILKGMMNKPRKPRFKSFSPGNFVQQEGEVNRFGVWEECEDNRDSVAMRQSCDAGFCDYIARCLLFEVVVQQPISDVTDTFLV